MVVLLLLLLPSFLHAQGHHVIGDRYVVEGTEDWGAWSLPKRAAGLTRGRELYAANPKQRAERVDNRP